MEMSGAELNPIRHRNVKKLLIILFSVIGLAAIITIITIVFINAGTNEIPDGG